MTTPASFTTVHPVLRYPGRRAALLLAGVTCLSACGSLLPPADLKPPTLAFEDLSIKGMHFDRIDLEARIATQNPNDIDLPLSKLRFDFLLMGQPVAQGAVTESRLLLPARGELTVPIALSVPMAELRQALFKLTRRAASDPPFWEVRGSAQWGRIPVAIPFAKHGDESSLNGVWDWIRR